ncbi:TKL/DRK protein kinase [Aphanomyces invadans]|uniref:TKL/DRK protein kinase n=1 Tax=Aphanomyces invadans TaxID=157072 RepID=A0A024TL57_9STRA|nr:TKL/DRK protein kinase [Aphanomyces invadans]ETV94341.1 TKL/DRK protein kinase [Aphanomyces invadans]|eukprot:XP_008877103.1 TKL/DRK protein kinase [Aphanomyces invadans]
MGCCFTQCIPDDKMVSQFEAELNEDVHVSVNKLQSKKSTFSGHASLLRADEVHCSQEIGKGDSGTVYKGTYRGSTVVEKRMTMSRTKASEAMEKSLEVVASRMSSLRHPNTVLFMGVCLRDQSFCIVSEYCARGSLYDILHTSQPSQLHTMHNMTDGIKEDKEASESGLHWNLRCRLALGAARGLLYLHSATPPLVHGQLTSANILVDDSWNAKLADFGTRQVFQAVQSKPRHPAKATGRLPYWTAPEVLKAVSDNIDMTAENPQGADIYSLGLILWELMSGEVPFAECEDYIQLRKCVLSGQRPAIQSGSTCPLTWTQLITKCWSQNRTRRPSAAQVVATLEEMLRSEPMMKKPSSRRKRTAKARSRRQKL